MSPTTKSIKYSVIIHFIEQVVAIRDFRPLKPDQQDHVNSHYRCRRHGASILHSLRWYMHVARLGLAQSSRLLDRQVSLDRLGTDMHVPAKGRLSVEPSVNSTPL